MKKNDIRQRIGLNALALKGAQRCPKQHEQIMKLRLRG
jgi:hypothetical protein